MEMPEMKRWPVIRHVRYFCLIYKVNRHYAEWQQLGYFPVNARYDYDVLDKVWRGEL
jgi:hypothetical protein